MADEIEAGAAAAKPLLGGFVMQGQATSIYAPPNTGKTLLQIGLCLDAIHRGIIDPGSLLYVNADDGSEGMATKARLFQDVGAHMLVPGFGGFKARDLADLLREDSRTGGARGHLVIIDTLKKFTDLMDKRRASEFAQACREFVLAGGTIVGLAHTTKNSNPDGTPRYQGTTDILEDFDAAYIGQLLVSKTDKWQLVKLTRLKARAASPETVAYAYLADDRASYVEKLASIRRVSADELDDFAAPPDESVSDPEVMEAFCSLIKAGAVQGQMALARAAAERARVSHRAALDILQKYTGDEPGEHLWNYAKGPRGVRLYRLIDQTKRDT